MTTTWLCELSYNLTRAVDYSLGGAARSGGRRQLSEEHVTYKLLDVVDEIGSVGAPVWIRDFGRPDESENGADLELWFWDQFTGRAVGWLIQAKRLYPPKSRDSSPRFAQLNHVVSGRPQTDLLMEAAERTPGLAPLYWLYGWDFGVRSACTGRRGCKCAPDCLDESLMVASASWISSKPGNTWHRAVQAAGGTVESITHLLCGEAASVERLVAQTNALNTDPDGPLIESSEGLPRYISDLIDPQPDFDQASDEGSIAQRLVLIGL